MKKNFTLILFLVVSISSFSQVLVINELDCDNVSAELEEIVEIKSQTPNFPTDGYIIVFFNGSENGGDSSYYLVDLDGFQTDNNGLLVIGGEGVSPYPQITIPNNIIQNGADAVAIYQASPDDFPEGTVATITNLVDVLIYDTNDADDTTLIDIFNDDPNFMDIQQISEGSGDNPNSIQRNNDGTYFVDTPTPRRLNDGSGIPINPITISVLEDEYNEGDSFEITFVAESNVASDVNFTISLNRFGFNTADYTGNVNLTIPNGQNTISTTITLLDDAESEGEEVLNIRFLDLEEPIVASNNNIKIRVVDSTIETSPWGTPVNPTFNQVTSSQPNNYYDSLDGLSDADLRNALQNIVADPNIVRAHTYTDVIDILTNADENPENNSEVWLVYLEKGRSKLDRQTGSVLEGKWSREHTFPQDRAGYFGIEEDQIGDGIDVFWDTEADSLRHGFSDAHALRVVDARENSSRNKKHYGPPSLGGYAGPIDDTTMELDTEGSFYGDVARSVLYLEIRYNGLQIVDGYPEVDGQLGDLATLLDWHRNDPPDDFEMNRNNVIYEWQRNRNPFIDQPLLVEYIWGNNVGDTWMQSLSIEDETLSEITIYPNPTSGRIYIRGLKSENTAELFSIDGKLLKRYNAVEDYLDLDLTTGIYLLKLNNGNGSAVKKIVIN
ncbi:endonuclease [Winogradskyella ursingii]|uniref:endonuclease n=1 Tax=Winogradskyella ursingii TaxID=2686079 RepID=UPI0015CA6410|nr:endonuclease [Winogradskyella ursingii]